MKQQNKRPSCLSRFIERYGQDCFDVMSPMDIRKNVVHIFKDIAYGNIVVADHERQLNNAKFINTSIEVLREIYTEHYVHRLAVSNLINQTNSGNNMFMVNIPQESLKKVYDSDNLKCEVYSRILNCLNAVVGSNFNFAYFTPLASSLNNPRQLRFYI